MHVHLTFCRARSCIRMYAARCRVAHDGRLRCVQSPGHALLWEELAMIGEKWSPVTAPCSVGALTITVVLSRPQPGTTVCTVSGTLNADTTPVLRDALVEARRDDNAHLVIDLSTIASMDMDSTG